MEDLLKDVENARQNFIDACSQLTHEQLCFKPSPASWSITEIAEHIVWAEQGGIVGIWKAIEGIKNNKPVWSGEAVHHGLSIEEVIEKTWQSKETVPENAKPRWGGPIEYWLSSLKASQQLLVDLQSSHGGLNPEQVIYPHIISGPLNVFQRMEFIRFHLERHQKQIENIKAHPDFPKKDGNIIT